MCNSYIAILFAVPSVVISSTVKASPGREPSRSIHTWSVVFSTAVVVILRSDITDTTEKQMHYACMYMYVWI